jgi:hypothetical protein
VPAFAPVSAALCILLRHDGVFFFEVPQGRRVHIHLRAQRCILLPLPRILLPQPLPHLLHIRLHVSGHDHDHSSRQQVQLVRKKIYALVLLCKIIGQPVDFLVLLRNCSLEHMEPIEVGCLPLPTQIRFLPLLLLELHIPQHLSQPVCDFRS